MNPRLRIIGIGNVLLGDEGVGVHLVRLLSESDRLPKDVDIVDGGTGGFTLLDLMQSADQVILMDATMDGQPIGTVTRIEPKYAKDFPPSLSAHDIGLKDLLDAFFLMGKVPHLVLYAISIEAIQELQTELSPELEGRLSFIAELIQRDIAALV